MNALRLLDRSEIELVAGGLQAPPDPNQCPVDEWWNPNWLTDDAGQIGTMPAQNGPFDRYWTNGTTWCLYDGDNNLLGVYVEDSSSSFSITFESYDNVPGSVTNTIEDSETGGSYTVHLKKVG